MLLRPLGVRWPWSSDRPTSAAAQAFKLRATPGNGEVSLTWTASHEAGVIGYALYWQQAPGVTDASTRIGSISSPYTHTGRSNGAPYYYRVRTVLAAGEGEWSNEVLAVPGAPITARMTDWIT